jgi:hypothetical protein
LGQGRVPQWEGLFGLETCSSWYEVVGSNISQVGFARLRTEACADQSLGRRDASNLWVCYFGSPPEDWLAPSDSRFGFLSSRRARTPTVHPVLERTTHMISNNLDCSCGEVCPSGPSSMIATAPPHRRGICVRKQHPSSLKSLTLVRSVNGWPALSTPSISIWAFVRRRLSKRRSPELTPNGVSSLLDKTSP